MKNLPPAPLKEEPRPVVGASNSPHSVNLEPQILCSFAHPPLSRTESPPAAMSTPASHRGLPLDRSATMHIPVSTHRVLSALEEQRSILSAAAEVLKLIPRRLANAQSGGESRSLDTGDCRAACSTHTGTPILMPSGTQSLSRSLTAPARVVHAHPSPIVEDERTCEPPAAGQLLQVIPLLVDTRTKTVPERAPDTQTLLRHAKPCECTAEELIVEGRPATRQSASARSALRQLPGQKPRSLPPLSSTDAAPGHALVGGGRPPIGPSKAVDIPVQCAITKNL